MINTNKDKLDDEKIEDMVREKYGEEYLDYFFKKKVKKQIWITNNIFLFNNNEKLKNLKLIFLILSLNKKRSLNF